MIEKEPKKGQGVYITPEEIAQITREIPRKMNLSSAAKNASKKLGYHITRLRGRGMSFAESRAYQPGDEIRHIDWRVTARTGEVYTKTFEEERDRPVFTLVDQTSSMFIGTKRCFKAYLAAELALSFSWLACRNQDPFGGMFIGAEPTRTRLRSGRKHWAHYCEHLLDTNQSWDLTQDNTQMNWAETFRTMQQEIRPGSLIVIISDFFNHDIDPQDLFQLRAHSDVICIGVQDPIEIKPPENAGPVGFSGNKWYYKGKGTDQQRLMKSYQNRWNSMKSMCAEMGIGFFTTSTHEKALNHMEAILR